jgi:pimeloyl-ACP methyl ester carboxylesterase
MHINYNVNILTTHTLSSKLNIRMFPKLMMIWCAQQTTNAVSHKKHGLCMVLAFMQDYLTTMISYLINDVDRYVLYKMGLYFAAFWIVLEIGFFLVVYFMVLPGLQKLNKPHAYPTDNVVFLKRILDSVKEIKSYTFEQYLQGFFRGAKFDDIYKDNFRSFLAWAMFGKNLEDLTEKDGKNINEVYDYAAHLCPVVHTLKPGFNPVVKHCAMTLEPIPVIHRPLLLYVLANLMEAASNTIFLRACGFQNLELNGMTYWYKKQGPVDSATSSRNTTSSTGSEPVVFFHGISTGWSMYLHLAKSMSKNRTLILVDLDAIKIKSMRFHMPTPQHFCECFNTMLDRHHIEKVSLIGHSFGSITAGWVVTRCSERISHLTLIDPVSMLLAFPEVAYSFLYRPPTSLIEWIIHVVASRELTVSHALHRHFWWYNNNLWLEDVPPHIGVVVGLAQCDEVTNPVALEEYVGNCQNKRIMLKETFKAANAMCSTDSSNCDDVDNGSGGANINDPWDLRVAPIKCVTWEKYFHGQILIPADNQTKFIEMVRANEKTRASKSV